MTTISVTLVGVHPSKGDQATMFVDAITRDEESREITFETNAALALVWDDMIKEGSEIRTVIDAEQIVHDSTTPTFQQTAEKFVASIPRIDDEDARILDQMKRTAVLIAEHEHAMLVTSRTPEKEMWQIAQDRRNAEAELNRLITNRVNKLATQHRLTMI